MGRAQPPHPGPGRTRVLAGAIAIALLSSAAPADVADLAGGSLLDPALAALLEGRLPDDAPVSSLFAVRLDRLPEVEGLFALAAICQHENLSTDELRRVLNVPLGFARFAMQLLTEKGLVVEKDGSADRVTLSAPLYRQTLRALRQKHLLFE